MLTSMQSLYFLAVTWSPPGPTGGGGGAAQEGEVVEVVGDGKGRGSDMERQSKTGD